MKRIPMRNLFAPTLVANGSDAEDNPFDLPSSGGSVPAAAVAAAVEAASEGGSESEIKAAAIMEGATVAQAEVIAAKAAKSGKKAGRPTGSKNKPKGERVSKKDKKTTAKAAKEAKDHPQSVGPLPADASKRIPADAYLVSMGRGTCAYSPSKRNRYKLQGGNIIHLGRKNEGTATNAGKPTTSASPKSEKKSDIASALAVLSAHLGVAEISKKMPGLKIVVDGGTDTAYAGKKRGRPAGGKNKPKQEQELSTALAANGLNRMNNLYRNSSDEAKVGPYSISLLRNPVADFQLAGIKVVPALLGAGGAVVLNKGFERIPMLAEIENKDVRAVAPSVLTMAAAAAAHWYAEKNGHSLVADVSSDVFAFGLALGVNSVLGSRVDQAIDYVKEKVSPKTEAPKTDSTKSLAPPAVVAPAATSPTTQGGRFSESRMSGGAWRAPAMQGYVTGRSSGYPKPDLSGSAAPGYPPAALYGNSADGTEVARALSPLLNGGQFAKKRVGIDMSGFAG